MKSTSLLCLGLLWAAASFPALAADPAFTAVGVRVGGVFPGQSFNFQPVPYNRGTVVDIYVASEGLVAIDPKNSKITTFADDRGKDLLKSSKTDPVKIGPFPKVNDARTAALFDVRSDEIPGKAATTLKIEGVLALNSATAKDRTTLKQIKLVKGAALEWGNRRLVVSQVTKADAIQLSLSTDVDIPELVGLSVVDRSGKRTAATYRARSTWESEGQRSFTLSYEIDAAGDTFDVTIEFWKDMTVVEVPFSVSVGLGL